MTTEINELRAMRDSMCKLREDAGQRGAHVLSLMYGASALTIGEDLIARQAELITRNIAALTKKSSQ